MKLGDIAEIKTGLVLSRKKPRFKNEAKFKYPVLMLKNIEEEGFFNDNAFDMFESIKKLDGRYFTREEDILIRLSSPNTVVFIDERHKDLLIPSYFAVIKLKGEKFIPKYLAWYLNTNAVKRELERFQSNTNMPVTNKNILKEITIKDLSKEKQSMVIDIHNLHYKKMILYQQLLEEEKKFYKSVISKIIN